MAGLNVYLVTAFWLFLWCGLLLWAFTGRLRRGLRHQIVLLGESWKDSKPAEGVFARIESECRRVERFREDLKRLHGEVDDLRHRMTLPDDQLGRRLA